jgi:hypothetical protein
MENNKKQTAVEWLFEQFYDNEGMLTTKKLMKAIEMEKEQRKTDYQDGKDFAIINKCAEQSTLDASSYAEGFTRGYSSALEYMINSIENQIKTKQGEE